MRTLARLVAVLALVAAAFPARAQQFCTPRDTAAVHVRFSVAFDPKGLT